MKVAFALELRSAISYLKNMAPQGNGAPGGAYSTEPVVATLDEVDRAIAEEANSTKPMYEYRLHGLWRAREIVASLKNKAIQSG